MFKYWMEAGMLILYNVPEVYWVYGVTPIIVYIKWHLGDVVNITSATFTLQNISWCPFQTGWTWKAKSIINFFALMEFKHMATGRLS